MMTFKYSILCVTVLTHLIIASDQSNWTLVWNDEFNTDQIDLNKWTVEDEKKGCIGNHIEQLQCHTSRSKNVRAVDGVLAITATKEKYLNKEYTSGLVSPKFNFTYGKVEIRASLPKGGLLRPAVWMLSERFPFDWPKRGQIDILSNIQNDHILSGVHFENNGPKFELGGVLVSNTSRLSNFHDYQIEWSKDSIKWSFDGQQYLQVNTNKKFGDIYERNGQPFDHDFQIFFSLGIGGKVGFEGLVLTEQDVRNWNCSVFMIDYIRIWKPVNNNDGVNNNLVGSSTDKSVNSICTKIMSEIDPNRRQAQKSLDPRLSASQSLIVNFMQFLTIGILIAKIL